MNKTKSLAKIVTLIITIMLFASTLAFTSSAASLSAPSKVTSSSSTTAIKLTWTKVKQATGYRIYYKLPGDISWRTGLKSTTKTTYTFKDLPEGQHYTFAVRSYKKESGKTTWSSYKQIKAATQTPAPKKITAEQTTTTIKLKWSSVKSADGYRIYYKTSASADWKTAVSSTTKTSYTFKKLTAGQKYYFAVKTYSKSSLGTFKGKSKSIETATKPQTPTLKYTIDGSTVSLSWSKVKATGYRVYYKTSSSASWKTAVSSTTATKCKIKNLAKDKNYYFAVRAYVKNESGTIWSEYKSVAVSTSNIIKNITWATGGPVGTYYALSTAIAYILNTDAYRFNVISTGGSQANIEMIADGEAEFAIVQSDVMNYAYEGAYSFSSPIKDFSVVAALYNEAIQIVTTKSTGIKSLTGLKGKRVAVGAIGSGTYYNAVHILEAAGIDITKDITPIYCSFGDAANSLKDGYIDVAFITAGAPTTAVTDLASVTNINIIPLTDSVIKNLISKHPCYASMTIPASTYNNVGATKTVSIKATIIASNKMSEDQVYRITKDLWAKRDEITTAHAKGKEMNLNKALDGIGNVPVHPGAKKYYKEVGLIK